MAWAFFLLMGFITASLHLYKMISKYMEYKVVEHMEGQTGHPVPFPSVTICSLDAWMMNKFTVETKRDRDLHPYVNFSLRTDYVARLNSLQGYYENVPYDIKWETYKSNELILHCTFGEETCSPDNFTLYFDGAHYYSCFTFNIGTGANSEAQDVLRTDKDDRWPYVSEDDTNHSKDGLNRGTSRSKDDRQTVPTTVSPDGGSTSSKTDENGVTNSGSQNDGPTSPKTGSQLASGSDKGPTTERTDKDNGGSTGSQDKRQAVQTSDIDNGNSHVTHLKGLMDDELTVQGTGTEYGLSLILGLANGDWPQDTISYPWYNMKSNIENSAGVRVTIHERNTRPFPIDHGFDVAPGYSTSVSLKASLRSRLPYPHGNCTTQKVSSDCNYRYKTFLCLQHCKQSIIVERCGCQASSLPTLKYPRNFTYCATINGWKDLQDTDYNQTTDRLLKSVSDRLLKNLTCEIDVIHEIARNRSHLESCDCPSPCHELRYEKSISASYWPLEHYQYDLLETYLNLDRIQGTYLAEAFKSLNQTNRKNISHENPAFHLIRKNLLRLNVYMEELEILEYKQVEAYGLEDLVADIGGALGLWMGVSVLSCVELFELILRLIGVFFSSRMPRDKPKKLDVELGLKNGLSHGF